MKTKTKLQAGIIDSNGRTKGIIDSNDMPKGIIDSNDMPTTHLLKL